MNCIQQITNMHKAIETKSKKKKKQQNSSLFICPLSDHRSTGMTKVEKQFKISGVIYI